MLVPHELIVPGARFDTEFEENCVVVEAPGADTGGFLARDSEGVECQFHTSMVLAVRA